MSLVSRLHYTNLIIGRYTSFLPRIPFEGAKTFVFSSVSPSSLMRHEVAAIRIQEGASMKRLRTCSSFVKSTNEVAGVNDGNFKEAIGTISARSRFKELPVHPSILSYIKRVGVGRERGERKRKRHPFRKKKKLNKGYYGRYEEHKLSGNFDTMCREEERHFLGNGRAIRRSGAANSAIHFGGRHRHRTNQSFSPVMSPPPPFGDGQHQAHRKVSVESDDVNDKRKLKCTATTNKSVRKIRVLPVKVLGRVATPSSPPPPLNDSNKTSHFFPRPTSGLPEVAIIGRSNVGKSTLLNALLYSGRSIEKEDLRAFVRRRNKKLNSRNVTSQTAQLPKGVKAKTSSKPGETRSIDFYQVSAEIEELTSIENDELENVKFSTLHNCNETNETRKRKKKLSLLLIDLPGYGFAFGPKKERKQPGSGNIETPSIEFLFPWQSLIETYITNRPRSSLKRVLLLIDARHGMKNADSHFLASLQRALRRRQRNSADSPNEQQRVPTELPPLQIVLTKCDLVSQVDLARRVVQVRRQLSECLVRQPKILPEMLVSAQMEGQGGVLELQKELASLCSNEFHHA